MGGWVVGVGWLEKSDIKLISAKVEVEVEAELGKMLLKSFIQHLLSVW